jgi:hypothetical protein
MGNLHIILVNELVPYTNLPIILAIHQLASMIYQLRMPPSTNIGHHRITLAASALAMAKKIIDSQCQLANADLPIVSAIHGLVLMIPQLTLITIR